MKYAIPSEFWLMSFQLIDIKNLAQVVTSQLVGIGNFAQVVSAIDRYW